ncbi:M16 family metallopeptidase [Sphingomonas hankookensis]|uniref:M16 family metallopeptidase n=1 Tax=Sphingomonas hankookensis TaxID=563996 RepID=UPI003D303602
MRAFAAQIAIPHSEFTLANGLRVIVHTDRGAPVVAVSVWYNVGSKHEPAGRSGFAHLFEHLMFNGSENVPGDYLRPLQEAGVIDFNGTTSNDRTNYYQTVPTAALDRVLFMESDRMGHLLGAVQQSVLDEQRGVVENEKRQGDDSPYSAISDRTTRTLYPADHPYGHSVIGSMADLESANLADVRGWFLGHYGPNNAVLVLAGDIDAATARPLVEKYFGDIRRGPANVRPAAPVPTLPRRVEERITAPVTSPSIVRTWAVPGYDDADSLGLDIASGVMAQIDGAPLQEALVRGARLFDNVSVSNATLMQGARSRSAGASPRASIRRWRRRRSTRRSPASSRPAPPPTSSPAGRPATRPAMPAASNRSTRAPNRSPTASSPPAIPTPIAATSLIIPAARPPRCWRWRANGCPARSMR